MDKYYSPGWMAQALCEHFSLSAGSRIFDPAMGAGALLEAAVARSNSSDLSVMGCDIDGGIVGKVRAMRPRWTVDRADLFSVNSRRQSRVWQSAKQVGVDAVVMNPPFSFRGGSRKVVSFFGGTYSLAPAVAALAIVLNDVSASQGVGAILPAGSLHGEANQEFWESLEQKFDVDIARQLPRGSFPDAKASSVLLTVRKRPAGAGLNRVTPAASLVPSVPQAESCLCIEVIRGRVQTSKRVDPHNDQAPYIHTTHLNNWKVSPGPERRPASLATSGPMLLLPRVGKFKYQKVAMADAGPVVLSDCVIALRAANSQRLQSLYSLLMHPSSAFESHYGGTGAPYVTVRKLVNAISQFGYTARHVPASSGDFRCTCVTPLQIQDNSISAPIQWSYPA